MPKPGRLRLRFSSKGWYWYIGQWRELLRVRDMWCGPFNTAGLAYGHALCFKDAWPEREYEGLYGFRLPPAAMGGEGIIYERRKKQYAPSPEPGH